MTGEIRPARCEANTCVYCLPRNVAARAAAIEYAAPERFIRYSLVGDAWETIANRYKQLTYRIRRAGYLIETCHFVEPNPKGTGTHIHAFQHGDYIPQRELVDLADSVGFGRNTDIRAWNPSTARAAGYGMKSAAGYGMKRLGEATAAAGEYLAWNGGRLHHHTRRFFRHPTGEHIGNVKKAVKAARRARYGDAGDWLLEREEVRPC